MAKDPEKRFQPSEQRRPRRLEEAKSAEIGFPLVWIIIGGLAGLIVIGLIGLGVVNLVRQGAITPTPQVLPPLVEPVETVPAVAETPAVIEATVPVSETVVAQDPQQPDAVATPESVTEQPPAEEAALAKSLVVNGYAKVIDTGGLGLSLRAGPGRNNARLGLAEESDDVQLLLLDGPTQDENGEDYIWWFVRHPDGTEGWVVEDYLLTVDAP